LIDARAAQQREEYRRRMPARASLERRVARLADIRREEGYMASSSRQPDGSWLLIENHCPICAAAEVCQGLCRAELWLFREVLGASVEREEYALEGGRRCTYRIRRRRTTRTRVGS
jgi:radical SAM protein with 4Fe4S-binding SPASM domain